MLEKSKKAIFCLSSILVYGSVLSASSDILFQGGPLGSVSIGDQEFIYDNDTSSINKKLTKNTSAKTTNNNNEVIVEMKKEMEEMRKQITEMKNNQNLLRNLSGEASQFSTYSSKVERNEYNKAFNENSLSQSDRKDIIANINSNNQIIDSRNQSFNGIFNDNGGINVGRAPAITTGGRLTFIGAYSGNNSVPMGQIPENLFASTLLGQREQLEDYSIFFGSFIGIDGQVFFGSKNISTNGDQGTFTSSGQNIYLTTANLYFLSNIGHYVTIQFDFDTDESNDFNLGNAFAIFGNLDASPFFVSVGKSFLSVGAYNGGGTLTNGITQNFFKPGQVTNVSINYKDDIWNANIAVSGADDQTANFSTGIFYANSWTDDLAVGLNVGYIYDIASAGDSESFKKFLNDDFAIIGEFNVDANFTYAIFDGLLNLGAGWSTTTNRQDFNNDGGNVLAGAWYTAANYSADIYGRDTNFGFSYGQTYNSAAIPMKIASSPITPDLSASGIQHQLIFSAQRAYFDDNVLIGPEYVYQKLYNGNHMNTITLDLSIFI